MALIDLALAQSTIVSIDATSNPNNSDLVNAGVLSADTVVYYGSGTVDLGNLLGIDALSSQYLVATDGANVLIDGGLLNVSALTNKTLIVDGASSITLDAGTLGLLGVNNLLSKTTIGFSGADDGTFTYDPPDIGVLSSSSLTVEDMGNGDSIVIPFAGSGFLGVNELREADTDGNIFNGVQSYDGTYMHLTNGNPLLNQVDIRIKMTQVEYDAYVAAKNDADTTNDWLNGSTDTFTYLGPNDPTDPNDAPCFARGTMIATADGAAAIEGLSAGDKVMTRDHGLQAIRWIGTRKLSRIDLLLHPNLHPIRIRAGALGNGTPTADLTVSPQHRVLVRSRIAERMFGKAEVLVAAKHLLDLDGVEIAEDLAEVEYFHMLFDSHEIVISNGAETESLYTGPQAIRSINEAGRAEIFQLFPELQDDGIEPAAARTLLTGREGRQLAFRHGKNGKPLVHSGHA